VQVREFILSQSGTNKLIILLLYEATLQGKWLQTIRQTVGVIF